MIRAFKESDLNELLRRAEEDKKDRDSENEQYYFQIKIKFYSMKVEIISKRADFNIIRSFNFI